MDEQTAEFKAMGDDNKATKNDAKESSKKYNYKSPFASKARDQPVINCDPLAFAVKNNKSAAGKRFLFLLTLISISLPHHFGS